MFRARSAGSPQLFCCKQHRCDYHRRGALPFEKLVDDVTKRIAPPLIERMEALEKRLDGAEWRTVPA